MDDYGYYIRMCEKAKKLQEQWKVKNDDLVLMVRDGGERKIKVVNDCADWEYMNTLESVSPDGVKYYRENYNWVFIWLPRRAQLHVMSNLSWWEFDKECKKIATCRCDGERTVNPLISKEQAGLMVVMNRKFEQVWKNGDWIHENVV